eukprot:1948721-Pyramimonas_sp.AAC.1
MSSAAAVNSDCGACWSSGNYCDETKPWKGHRRANKCRGKSGHFGENGPQFQLVRSWVVSANSKKSPA